MRYKTVVMTKVHASATACAIWMPNRPKSRGRISSAGMKKSPCRGGGKHGSISSLPHGLHHHVIHNNPSVQYKSQALEPKRRRSDPDDFRIISENADQMAGQQRTGDRQDEQGHGGDLHTEPESIPDTAIFLAP